MSKKALMCSLLIASMCSQGFSKYSSRGKSLEGSAIYIPKRHKFKKRNKR